MRHFGQFSSHGRHDLAKSRFHESAIGDFGLRANIKRLLFGVVLSAALTGPAMAEEQLVMPFACRVEGGKVLLAPSAPQTYQIYGHRQRKRLTTCSPFDPRRCQNWFIHRFDLDCGGVRTSWQSVVTAMTPMLVARSNGEPARVGEAPPGARPYQAGRGPAIRFPPGYAPNPMMVASFKQTKAAPAQIALPTPKPDVTAPAQTAEIEPPSKPVAAPSVSPGKADAAGKTSPDEKKSAEPAKYQALQIEIDSGSGEVTGSLPKSGATSGSLWRDATMVFALTLAALLALSTTILLWQRRMQTMPLAIAHLWHGHTTRGALTRTADSEGGRATDHQQEDNPGTRLRLWDEDWLPATMSEALDVLGVDPEASGDTMKTTVTRLRRALHPDYALDEEDRRLRERRLKQINVAWDIVSGKRRSLWPSLRPRSS